MKVARDIALSRLIRSIDQSPPGLSSTRSTTRMMDLFADAVQSAASVVVPRAVRRIMVSRTLHSDERIAAVPSPSWAASPRMRALSIRSAASVSGVSPNEMCTGSGRLLKSIEPAPGPNV